MAVSRGDLAALDALVGATADGFSSGVPGGGAAATTRTVSPLGLDPFLHRTLASERALHPTRVSEHASIATRSSPTAAGAPPSKWLRMLHERQLRDAAAGRARPDIVALARQSWERRTALRENLSVDAVLHAWWELALRVGLEREQQAHAAPPRPPVNDVTFAQYAPLMACVYKRLINPFDPADAWHCVVVDWERDTAQAGGHAVLGRAAFMDAIFELADAWVRLSVHADDYVTFLQTTLDAISERDGGAAATARAEVLVHTSWSGRPYLTSAAESRTLLRLEQVVPAARRPNACRARMRRDRRARTPAAPLPPPEQTGHAPGSGLAMPGSGGGSCSQPDRHGCPSSSCSAPGSCYAMLSGVGPPPPPTSPPDPLAPPLTLDEQASGRSQEEAAAAFLAAAPRSPRAASLAAACTRVAAAPPTATTTLAASARSGGAGGSSAHAGSVLGGAGTPLHTPRAGSSSAAGPHQQAAPWRPPHLRVSIECANGFREGADVGMPPGADDAQSTSAVAGHISNTSLDAHHGASPNHATHAPDHAPALCLSPPCTTAAAPPVLPLSPRLGADDRAPHVGATLLEQSRAYGPVRLPTAPPLSAIGAPKGGRCKGSAPLPSTATARGGAGGGRAAACASWESSGEATAIQARQTAASRRYSEMALRWMAERTAALDDDQRLLWPTGGGSHFRAPDRSLYDHGGRCGGSGGGGAGCSGGTAAPDPGGGGATAAALARPSLAGRASLAQMSTIPTEVIGHASRRRPAGFDAYGTLRDPIDPPPILPPPDVGAAAAGAAAAAAPDWGSRVTDLSATPCGRCCSSPRRRPESAVDVDPWRPRSHSARAPVAPLPRPPVQAPRTPVHRDRFPPTPRGPQHWADCRAAPAATRSFRMAQVRQRVR